MSFAIFEKSWTEKTLNDCCILSSKLITHLLQIWTPETHLYNVNVPLIRDVLTTKIYFTRLLENRSGSLFRLLSAEENHSHEQELRAAENMAKVEQKLPKNGSLQDNSALQDDETDWHDDTDILSLQEFEGIKRWQWSVDFKQFEAFVAEHGTKGGGMTDGWCINQRWASVTALKASYQVVDGGGGGTHGGEEIILGP